MIKIKIPNKLFLTLFMVVLFSCGNNNDIEPEQKSIIGTWKIESLTINGTENLKKELGDLCYWTLEFAETTFTEFDFSGADCSIKTVDGGGAVSYTISETNISYITNKQQVSRSLEILEFTNKTLKVRDFVYGPRGASEYIYTYLKLN